MNLLFATIVLGAWHAPLFAQQATGGEPPEPAASEGEDALDRLIPDDALEDPQGWAREAAADQGESASGEASAAPDTDSPLDEIAQIALEWPDPAGDDSALDPSLASELASEPASTPGAESMEEESDAIEALAEAVLPNQPAAERAFEVPLGKAVVLDFRASEGDARALRSVVERFRALSALLQLEKTDRASVAVRAARAREDERLLLRLLRLAGYYDARVSRRIAAVQEGEGEGASPRAVRFEILAHARYALDEVDFGALAQTADYESLRAAFDMARGDPLDAWTIEAERTDLIAAIGESGYPFARVGKPQLTIDHEARSGDLAIDVAPNGRFAFGPVRSDHERVLSSRHLARIARFRPGELYRASLAEDLRRAILATGLASAARVEPREIAPPSGDEPGVVALDVALEPAPMRSVSGAIGYGSEEGFEIRASWEHRNLFPSEGALRLRGVLGTRQQLGGVAFRKNNFRKRDQVLLLDLYASDVRTDALEARAITFRASLERLSNLLFQKPFSWSFGVETSLSDERNRTAAPPAPARRTYRIAGLFGRATIDTTDSLFDPSRGWRITGFLAPEVSRVQGQSSAYLRNQLDASFYQQFSGGVIGAARLRLATILGAPLDRIAPTRRLYAGGGGSVRGYGYQAIGPLDGNGDPTGGRSLAEFSLEARVKTGLFDGALSLVPFFDAGSVATGAAPDLRDVRYGAGLGLRYESGFGPIRIDLAAPINPRARDERFAVYVSLGQSF